MGLHALDHRRIDDGGDDLQLAVTVRALFEVDGGRALEQPRPTQARRSVVRADRLGEKANAHVATRNRACGADLVRAHYAQHLADHKVLDFFTFRTEPLPRNANGNVLKRALRG